MDRDVCSEQQDYVSEVLVMFATKRGGVSAAKQDWTEAMKLIRGLNCCRGTLYHKLRGLRAADSRLSDPNPETSRPIDARTAEFVESGDGAKIGHTSHDVERA
jgi:hypothetical protein